VLLADVAGAEAPVSGELALGHWFTAGREQPATPQAVLAGAGRQALLATAAADIAKGGTEGGREETKREERSGDERRKSGG
jgi:hypothetical protein